MAQEQELVKVEKLQLPLAEHFCIIEGKFEDSEKYIPDNSIDAIITDPPYGDEYLHVWEDLSRIGSRILKPSGWLVTYAGTLRLPDIMHDLCKYLKYYCQIIIWNKGLHRRFHQRNIFEEYRSVLIFQKPPFKKTDHYFGNVIKSWHREKDLHEWQQSEDAIAKLIEIFTKPGDLILDSYAGTGTTLAVANRLMRNSIGIDSDPECIKIMKHRFMMFEKGGMEEK